MLNESEQKPDLRNSLDSLDYFSGGVIGQPLELSFDSGYSSSPVKYPVSRQAAVRISPHRFSSFPSQLNASKSNMAQRLFMNSPFKSPLKSGIDVGIMGSNLTISPLKLKNEQLSPFKAVLSPFKVPSNNGTPGMDFQSDLQQFEDWDKDIIASWDKEFITSFEENLFDMNEGLSDNVIEELLKSPQGKAILEKRNASPRRPMGSKFTAMKVKHSPTSTGYPVVEPVEGYSRMVPSATVQIKEEPNDMEYFLHTNTSSGNNIVLSVTDPNKMNATPVKPRYKNVEKVPPKRKLSMKAPVPLAPLEQKENMQPGEWPSKEKLKYARAQFQQTLAKAVDAVIQQMRADKKAKADAAKHTADAARQAANKDTSKGHAVKAKQARRGKAKEQYPQIKKALSKPTTVTSTARLQGKSQARKRHCKNPAYYKNTDWLIDSGEEEETWTGPPPFSSRLPSDSDSDELLDDSDDDEYWEPPGHRPGKKCGYRVLVKKRKK